MRNKKKRVCIWLEMAQLWGGRFTKETDKLVYNFNASISLTRNFMSRISEEAWHM